MTVLVYVYNENPLKDYGLVICYARELGPNYSSQMVDSMTDYRGLEVGERKVLQRPTIISLLGVFVVVLLLLTPSSLRALTVSPSYSKSKDLSYVGSGSFEFGEREYDIETDFASQIEEQTGSHNLVWIRNDFNFTRRFTVGLNFLIGSTDYGSLQSGTDTVDLEGDVGLGGGLRISTLLIDDFLYTDWFADFQASAITSEPSGAHIDSEDWHLAFGAQKEFEWFLDRGIVEGGAVLTKSQFDYKGSSENDTPVEISADEDSDLGLFINTRVPISERMELLGEVMFTGGVSVNIGANYRFKVLDFVPGIARREVEGAQDVPDEERRLTSKEYLARARTAIRNNNNGKALDWLSAALSTDPQSSETYYQIGRNYYLIGEFDRALEYSRQAVELEPDNPDYHYNLGLVYEKLNRNDQAIDEYDKVIKLDPTNQEALYRMNNIEEKY